MSDRIPAGIGRRELLRVIAVGGVAAAAGAAPLTPAAAASVTNAEKTKARYQANAPDVEAFYRVNRYPTKQGRR